MKSFSSEPPSTTTISMPAMSVPLETGFSIGLSSHDHCRATLLDYLLPAEYFMPNWGDENRPEVPPALTGVRTPRRPRPAGTPVPETAPGWRKRDGRAFRNSPTDPPPLRGEDSGLSTIISIHGALPVRYGPPRKPAEVRADPLPGARTRRLAGRQRGRHVPPRTDAGGPGGVPSRIPRPAPGEIPGGGDPVFRNPRERRSPRARRAVRRDLLAVLPGGKPGRPQGPVGPVRVHRLPPGDRFPLPAQGPGAPGLGKVRFPGAVRRRDPFPARRLGGDPGLGGLRTRAAHDRGGTGRPSGSGRPGPRRLRDPRPARGVGPGRRAGRKAGGLPRHHTLPRDSPAASFPPRTHPRVPRGKRHLDEPGGENGVPPAGPIGPGLKRRRGKPRGEELRHARHRGRLTCRGSENPGPWRRRGAPNGSRCRSSRRGRGGSRGRPARSPSARGSSTTVPPPRRSGESPLSSKTPPLTTTSPTPGSPPRGQPSRRR